MIPEEGVSLNRIANELEELNRLKKLELKLFIEQSYIGDLQNKKMMELG